MINSIKQIPVRSVVYCLFSRMLCLFAEYLRRNIISKLVNLSPNTLLTFVAAESVILTKGLITSLQAMAAEPFRIEEIVLKYKT